MEEEMHQHPSSVMEYQRIFGTRQVLLMSASATQAHSLTNFPKGIDAHWETEVRTVWNARESTAEEHELVYEISWVSELGAWRRFLRSERKVKA